jgi:hypothetical protein
MQMSSQRIWIRSHYSAPFELKMVDEPFRQQRRIKQERAPRLSGCFANLRTADKYAYAVRCVPKANAAV